MKSRPWMVTAVAGALCGAIFIAIYLYVALSRAAYPFDLEWMEGGTVAHAVRLSKGLPLFSKPSVEWIPYIYPPFYYIAAWPLVALLENDHLAGRIVSLLAFAALLGTAFGLAWRLTRSRLAGVSAAGLIAAAHPLCGTWYDLARVDTLYCALLLGGCAALVLGRRVRSALLAAILLALAWHTKQTGAAFVVVFTIVLWGQDRRRALAFGATALSACLIPFFAAVAVTDRWYWFYLVTMPGAHAIKSSRFLTFWNDDYFASAPVYYVGFSVGLLYLSFASLKNAERATALLAAGAWTALLSSYVMRSHSGSYINVLMPLVVFAAPVFVTGVSAIAAKRVAKVNAPEACARGNAVACVAAAIAMLTLFVPPRNSIPGDGDWHAAENFRRFLDEHPDAVAPYQGLTAQFDGRPLQGHMMAYWDLTRSTLPEAKRFRAEIAASLRSPARPPLIVNDRLATFQDAFAGQAFEELPIYDGIPGKPLAPRTGFQTRPVRFYPAPVGGASARAISLHAPVGRGRITYVATEQQTPTRRR